MLELAKLSMHMVPVLGEIQQLVTLIGQKASELFHAMQAITINDVKAWMAAHRTILMGLVFVTASIIILTTPVAAGLAIVGINAAVLGKAGVTPASLAAVVRSKIGTAGAVCLFATLQSAGGDPHGVLENMVAIAGRMGLAVGLQTALMGIAKEGVGFEGLDGCKGCVDGQRPEHCKEE